MKWFKHMVDASGESTVAKIEAKFGLEGYARWFKLLEKVASEMKKPGQCSASYPWKKWQTFLGGKRKKLETFLKHLENQRKITLKPTGDVLEIFIPKLLEIKDNYQKDLEVSGKPLGSNLLPIQNKRTEKEEQQERVVVESGSQEEKAVLRDALIARGISPATADRLASDYPPERVQEVLQAYAEQPPPKTPGWIVYALEGNWDLNKYREQKKHGGRVMPTADQEKAQRRRNRKHQEKAEQDETEHLKRVAEIESVDPDGWGKAKDIILADLRKACPRVNKFPTRLVEIKALEIYEKANPVST